MFNREEKSINHEKNGNKVPWSWVQKRCFENRHTFFLFEETGSPKNIKSTSSNWTCIFLCFFCFFMLASPVGRRLSCLAVQRWRLLKLVFFFVLVSYMMASPVGRRLSCSAENSCRFVCKTFLFVVFCLCVENWKDILSSRHIEICWHFFCCLYLLVFYHFNPQVIPCLCDARRRILAK